MKVHPEMIEGPEAAWALHAGAEDGALAARERGAETVQKDQKKGAGALQWRASGRLKRETV
jgi:hypothetical protein